MNSLLRMLRHFFRLPFVIVSTVILAAFGIARAETYAVWKISDEISSAKVTSRALTVEIGRSADERPGPQCRLSAWGGECSLLIHLSNDKGDISSAPRPFLVDHRPGLWFARDNNIDSTPPVVAHQLYTRPDGALEWEIILERAPDTDVVYFSLETKGFEFLYQPELTAAEIASGAERPDSVIGSYAVYCSGKKGNRLVVGRNDTTCENYGAGKAFHIYRPKAHDSRGWTVWCNLNIDSFLTITIPRRFLEQASYPVTIDPTFGNINVGASTAYLSTSVCHALAGSSSCRHTASGGDIITSYSIYCLTYTNPAYVSFAVYSYANGYPDSRLASGVQLTVTNSGMQWNTTAAVSQALSAGTTYAVAFGDVSPASAIRARFDSENNVVSVHNATSLPATWSQSSAANNRWSIYATYTAGTSTIVSPRRKLIELARLSIDKEIHKYQPINHWNISVPEVHQ